MNWADDGAKVHIYLSTDGDYVDIGTRTEYPFESGGPNGTPLGWQSFNDGVVTDVSRSVQLNRFNIGIASGVTPVIGKYYGAYRDYTISDGRTYIMRVQARQTEGRDLSNRNFVFTIYNGGGTQVGQGQSLWPAQSDWEDITLYVIAPTLARTLRVYLEGGARDTTNAPNWGVQYQGFSVTDMDPTQPAPTWKEVTCDASGFRTRYGRDKVQNRYEIGSLQIAIQNDDGDWTYQNPHPFGLRPGRFIKATVTKPGGTVELPMFYGIVDSLGDSYTIDGHSYKNVQCVDISSLLSNSTVPTTWSENTEQNTSTRIYVLLVSSGWIRTEYDYDGGLWMQQTPRSNGRTVRDEISLSAESEGGYLWTNRSGRIVYHNRDWKPTRTTTVQAELLATPYCQPPLPIVDAIPTIWSAPIVELQSIQTDWLRSRVINVLMLANQGGNAATYRDNVSTKKYGPITYQRTDFLNSNAHPEYIDQRAADFMTGFNEAILRVNQVTFRPDVNSYDWVTQLWMQDLVRVRYELQRPDGSMWGWAMVTHVQGIEHAFSVNDWQVTLNLDGIEAFNFWQTSVADEGWDIDSWDAAYWDGGGIAKWSSGDNWNDPNSFWGA
jgi:hypothetical protein